MSAPATAGPPVAASCQLDERHALALRNSCGGTSFGNSRASAGGQKAARDVATNGGDAQRGVGVGQAMFHTMSGCAWRMRAQPRVRAGPQKDERRTFYSSLTAWAPACRSTPPPTSAAAYSA